MGLHAPRGLQALLLASGLAPPLHQPADGGEEQRERDRGTQQSPHGGACRVRDGDRAFAFSALFDDGQRGDRGESIPPTAETAVTNRTACPAKGDDPGPGDQLPLANVIWFTMDRLNPEASATSHLSTPGSAIDSDKKRTHFPTCRDPFLPLKTLELIRRCAPGKNCPRHVSAVQMPSVASSEARIQIR